jgi:hypothetical protein
VASSLSSSLAENAEDPGDSQAAAGGNAPGCLLVGQDDAGLD